MAALQSYADNGAVPPHFAFPLLLCCALGAARADDWPAAQPQSAISPDGRHVLRVLPGSSIGDTVGFQGAARGPYARALVYRLEGGERYVKVREVTLANPVAPVFVAIADGGEFATLDNWHNMGMGRMLVVYDAEGKLRRAWTLADLYTEAERERLQRSTSSTWWRCPALPVLQPRTSTLLVTDRLGQQLAIDLRSGELARRPAPQPC